MNGDVIQVEFIPTFPLLSVLKPPPNFILSLFAYKRQIVRGRLNRREKGMIDASSVHSPSAACLYEARAATLP